MQSTTLLDAIEQAMQVGLATVDLHGVQTYVNAAFCRMLGYEADDLVGLEAPFPYWPPEEVDAIQAAFAKTMGGEAPPEGFELRFARKDGARVDVQLALAPLREGDDVVGWLASVTDITGRKRAEARLAEAQHLAGIGDWYWDIATNEVRWSPELFRQYGRDPETFTPSFEGFLQSITDEDRPRVEEALQQTLEEGMPYDLEIRIRRPAGEHCVQQVLGRLERDHDGKPVRMFGTSQDITERRRLEQERLDETIQRVAISFGDELGDELEKRLLQRITDEATNLTGADYGALFFNVTDEAGDSFMLYTLSGAPSEAFEDFPLPRATPLFTPTFTGTEIVRSEDVRKDPRYGKDGPMPEGHLPVVSYLAVPVRSRTGEVLGGLFFGHAEADRFTARHERLAAALAAHAAVALDNARFYKQLRASEEAAHAARAEAENNAAILADQRSILELIASGSPLEATLEQLVLSIERHADEPVRASVLLLDPEQRCLLHGAAPNLPAAYNEAIHGLAIGPEVGSCGTAAYRDREVMVTDIATDPLWADYKELALAHGLRSCWSVPLRAADGGVIGTVAVYGDETGEPTEPVQNLMATFSRIAAIAIERTRVEGALREANSRKDEFMALLGHELRNPLAPILTALELMDMREPGCEKERGTIRRHVGHMVRLVDDLLDVSRVTQGKIRIKREAVEVRRILEEAAETAGPLFDEYTHHVSMEVEPPELTVDGDAVRLTQVFTNLLTNAAKYTPRGGQIDIHAQEDGDHAIVTVTDNGIGIDPELLPDVFEPFTQGGRGIDRAQGGLGLGLPLVKSLVALHGGEVAASSGPGSKGTRIRVRLPGAATAGVVVDTTRAVAASSRPAGERVLVVDDNHDAALMLADLLRTVGYEIEVAHDGPEALALLDDKDFEIAVVDIGLPVMDGYELGRRILEKTDLHMIALTGYGQDRDRERSAAVGFAAHLVKPVTSEALLSALDERGTGRTRTPA